MPSLLFYSIYLIVNDDDDEEEVQAVPAVLGESLTLECDADAVTSIGNESSVAVEWHRWSGVSRHRAAVAFGSLLNLHPVSRADEGVYRCTVFHPHDKNLKLYVGPFLFVTVQGNL